MDAYAPEIERMMKRLFDSLSRERSTTVCGHRGRRSWGMVGSSTSRASWGAIPRPSARDWRNWKGRTTWTRVVSEKKGWTQTVDRDRPDVSKRTSSRCSRTTPLAIRCGPR